MLPSGTTTLEFVTSGRSVSIGWARPGQSVAADVRGRPTTDTITSMAVKTAAVEKPGIAAGAPKRNNSAPPSAGGNIAMQEHGECRRYPQRRDASRHRA